MRNLLFLLALFSSVPCEAAEYANTKSWYADIHIYQGRAHNKLTIGQNIKATEGPDKNWETPIPKTFMSGGVSSFFYHPEWKKISPHFWRDIRPWGKFPRTWQFTDVTVKTRKTNVEVELNWDVGRVKKGIRLYLKRKEDKEYINLHNKKIYTYKSALTKTGFLLKAEQITQP